MKWMQPCVFVDELKNLVKIQSGHPHDCPTLHSETSVYETRSLPT